MSNTPYRRAPSLDHLARLYSTPVDPWDVEIDALHQADRILEHMKRGMWEEWTAYWLSRALFHTWEIVGSAGKHHIETRLTEVTDAGNRDPGTK